MLTRKIAATSLLLAGLFASSAAVSPAMAAAQTAPHQDLKTIATIKTTLPSADAHPSLLTAGSMSSLDQSWSGGIYNWDVYRGPARKSSILKDVIGSEPTVVKISTLDKKPGTPDDKKPLYVSGVKVADLENYDVSVKVSEVSPGGAVKTVSDDHLVAVQGLPSFYSASSTVSYIKQDKTVGRDFDPLGLVTLVAGREHEQVLDGFMQESTSAVILGVSHAGHAPIQFAVGHSDLVDLKTVHGRHGTYENTPEVVSQVLRGKGDIRLDETAVFKSAGDPRTIVEITVHSQKPTVTAPAKPKAAAKH